jgi:hypothetical protein
MEYLSEAVNRLSTERRFPSATRITQDVSWSLHGPAAIEKGTSWLARMGAKLRVRSPRRSSFELELADPPGGLFGGGETSQQVVEHMASAQGLIYLVDPLHNGDAVFSHFHNALTLLAAHVRSSGRLVDGRLPHHLTVCVAKFDDPKVLSPLMTPSTSGMLRYDANGVPRIRDDRSRDFFGWVLRELLGGSANMIQAAVEAHFAADRVRYVATSAIGFWLGPDNRFDPDDFSNVEIVDGNAKLRGIPRPINVLEPLVWLEERISASDSLPRRRGV